MMDKTIISFKNNECLFFLAFILVATELIIRIILSSLPLPLSIAVEYQWALSALVRLISIYILVLFAQRWTIDPPLNWGLSWESPRDEFLIALPCILGGTVILGLYHYDVGHITSLIAPIIAKPTLGQLSFWIISAVILAPLCEEILFRAIFFSALRDLYKGPMWLRVGVATIVSSLFFALLHLPHFSLQGLQASIIPFICALIGCALFQWRGNILAATLIHSCANLYLFLLAYL